MSDKKWNSKVIDWVIEQLSAKTITELGKIAEDIGVITETLDDVKTRKVHASFFFMELLIKKLGGKLMVRVPLTHEEILKRIEKVKAGQKFGCPSCDFTMGDGWNCTNLDCPECFRNEEYPCDEDGNYKYGTDCEWCGRKGGHGPESCPVLDSKRFGNGFN